MSVHGAQPSLYGILKAKTGTELTIISELSHIYWKSGITRRMFPFEFPLNMPFYMEIVI